MKEHEASNTEAMKKMDTKKLDISNAAAVMNINFSVRSISQQLAGKGKKMPN